MGKKIHTVEADESLPCSPLDTPTILLDLDMLEEALGKCPNWQEIQA